MASKFECEVRFSIPNIVKFKKRLGELHAKLIYPYEFTDHYYKPKNSEPWDPSAQALRIREWKKPERKSEVLFTRIETIDRNGFLFKRLVYPQGKVQLLEGDLELCKKFLEELGFEGWFKIVKKDCKIFEIPRPRFRTIHESIKGLGWTGELEVEGSNVERACEKLNKFLSVLEIPKSQVTFKPLGRIYAEKLGYYRRTAV